MSMTYKELVSNWWVGHEEFQAKLATLLSQIKVNATKQFKYNLETNVPKGILSLDECVDQAINTGLVSTVSAINQWDTDKAIELAYNILEDSNCHSEAAVLLKLPSESEAA